MTTIVMDDANRAAATPKTVATTTRQRDLRLDFFRGIAMFIILVAHIQSDWLALWIPARFGFSDATEMFVFCSGMASAIAFGRVFREQGLLIGTSRVLYRMWQVYWAHIGFRHNPHTVRSFFMVPHTGNVSLPVFSHVWCNWFWYYGCNDWKIFT